MVSFQCDGCADTVKKPKLDSHRQRCHASFTCLDCSTTFHNGEYNCVSEAEKYQGALYKGVKKGKGPAAAPSATFTEAPPAPAPAPVDEAPAASTSTIHPSRLQAIESSAPSNHPYPQSFSRGRGRGGFNASAPPPPARGGRGFGRKAGVTGENTVAPSGGMRSWGSTPVNGSPVPESAPSFASVPFSATVNGNGVGAGVGVGEDKKKKKKNKKGDKGGTGSKANSASKAKSETGEAAVEKKGETVIVAPGPSTTTTTTTANGGEEEPSAKKRKRDEESAPAVTPNGNGIAPSEKTLKRLRKNVTKLESDSATTLSDFIGKVGKGKKDEVIGRDEIMLGIKVVKVDGKWVLEV